MQKAKKPQETETNFLFNISHDIRIPMNAFLGFIELARCNIRDTRKAENGANAVNILLSSNYSDFDIVLMDIQMPVMDGYTATKKIRSFSAIPIVAVTANAFQSDRDIALSVGMNEHITKPISFDTLKNTITRVLSK